MNVARVAALLRELADVVEERDVPEDRPSHPRPRARRRPRELVVPTGEADELAQARARKMLHHRGYREVPK